MKNQFEIEYKKINPLVPDESERERYEEFYFSAQDQGKEIGHLITTKVLEPLDDIEMELGNPVASFGSVEPAYRRKGVMSALLYKANEFCKKQYDKPLISGFNDSENMKYLWKKLYNEEKAKRNNYNGLEYWIMK